MREWARTGSEGPRPKICRLCGRDGLPSRRYSWHPRCADTIQAALFQGSATRWCLRRQRGVCASCPKVLAVLKDGGGSYGPYWDILPRAVEIDHVVPLWRVATFEASRQTIRWWLPGNLQVLCVPCYRAKTKREAAERAELRAPQIALFSRAAS